MTTLKEKPIISDEFRRLDPLCSIRKFKTLIQTNLMIEVDLCYELDPYELKLDEMIEAEPEPEMIEGLPASDALTPADRYLELFEHVQSAKIFPDSKTFPDCTQNGARWIF